MLKIFFEIYVQFAIFPTYLHQIKIWYSPTIKCSSTIQADKILKNVTTVMKL